MADQDGTTGHGAGKVGERTVGQLIWKFAVFERGKASRLGAERRAQDQQGGKERIQWPSGTREQKRSG